MENYWNGLFGQDYVKEILSGIVKSSKIPHAFLFQGVEGCGKEFTAIRFVQALNGNVSASLNITQIINSIASLSEPYVKYIIPLPRGKNENDDSGPFEKLSDDDIQLYKDELAVKIKNPYHKINLPKANNIKINSIRDIKKFLSLSFGDISYRVIIISDAHLMNEAAQNALLKNLEEPPEGVIFIVSTPYPEKLRETIRSRCWLINFQPLSNENIKEILIEYYNVDSKLSESVAQFSGGSVTTALKLIENDFESLLDKTIYILRYSFGKKYDSALLEFSQFISDGDAETIRLLIQLIIIWLNDLQKYKLNTDDYYFKKHLETLEKFNQKFPDIEVTNCVYTLDRLSAMLQNHININLIVINTIFELANLTKQLK